MSKPSLFPTEWALRRAWEALTQADPDLDMTPDQAEDFLATYVDRKAAVAKRDELGDFIDGMHAVAEAKRAQAKALLQQAEQIDNGMARMERSTIKLMDALKLTELRGQYRILKVKSSPGAVEVIDEQQVPDDFYRIRTDEDFEAIQRLTDLVLGNSGENAAADEEALVLFKQAEARRRVVDKNAIKAAWKQAGGDTLPDGGLVVPGTAKRVDRSLVVK